MTRRFAGRPWLAAICGLLLGGGGGGALAVAAPGVAGAALVVTNLAQARSSVAQVWRTNCAIRLDGVICAVHPDRHWIILQDDTGAELLELEPGSRPLEPGQRVALRSDWCEVSRRRYALGLSRAPLIDNDGLHGMTEQSGAVVLSAGRQPIRLGWFNQRYQYGLEVSYAGPGLARSRVPDSALFRAVPGSANGQAPGLDYRSYEGYWNTLPDFSSLNPVMRGAATNFDLGLKRRDEFVGIEFTGFLEAPGEGRYTFWTRSDDGSRLFVGELQPRVEVVGTGPVPEPRLVEVDQALPQIARNEWLQVEGKVGFVSRQDANLELELGRDHFRVLLADAGGLTPGPLLNRRVRVAGAGLRSGSGAGPRPAAMLLALGAGQPEILDPSPASGPGALPENSAAPGAAAKAETNGPLPLLATADQVRRLRPAQADRGYPVKVRGVVTGDDAGFFRGFFFQDATSGIFVTHEGPIDADRPRLGEEWELEGVTGRGDFAPTIHAQRLTRMGLGRMPAPIYPAWDQFNGATLEAQYVEIEGVALVETPETISLLMRGGRIAISFTGGDRQDLTPYEHCLIRIRGVFRAVWDAASRQFKLGQIQFGSPSITVEQPAPRDPFQTPLKTAGEMLLFDPQADLLQRVKVAGLVVGERQGQFYLMDGTNGLRFLPRPEEKLQAGDRVEVVGFPDLTGPSPRLQEAVVRKLGVAPLPKVCPLVAEELLQAGHDATRVELQALLLQTLIEPPEQVLELESGLVVFRARLNRRDGTLPRLAPGSRLELDAVYVGQGGNPTSSNAISSFELLLGGPGDVRVLSRPAWWTPQRVLIITGVLLLVLLAALAWIKQLHRTVAARTAELVREGSERERAERQATLERERARIAQDLHDDLGAHLTRITMLSETAQVDLKDPGKAAASLANIFSTARELTRAMDEIVWAVNPKNDTLEGLVGYLERFAQDLLTSAGMRLRLDLPTALPNWALTAEIRHNVFLALKEALNNAVRHSGGQALYLSLELADQAFTLVVRDDGKGFEVPVAGGGGAPGGDGLENMRRRLARLGGCEIQSQPGAGTTVRLSVPLPSE